MFQEILDLWTISVHFDLLLFQDSDTLWIPDRLWTQTTVEKVAVGSRRPDLSFSSLYPKPSPFVSSSARKTLLWNSFLSFGPKFACVCMKPWYSYGELTRRRNENKRSLKAMNHACHHQRGGWCGSLLGSYKPLGVMEEVRADLYTHKCAHMHRCSLPPSSPPVS